MTGKAPLPDSMPRQQLDVDSQSTASSTMKIHIDQYAGSFEGQQRQKLELAGDQSGLERTRRGPGKGDRGTTPHFRRLLRRKKTRRRRSQEITARCDTQIARGQSLVADLVQKSEGTPYAFIGLQLVDITELHISPGGVST